MVATSSCADKVRISGTVTGAPDSKVIVKQLAGSGFNVLDTLKTDGSGDYTYNMEVKEGQPEFVYVFKGDTKIASLLLQKGDRVKVVSDTLGNYSVEGSEESAKLRQVEEEFAWRSPKRIGHETSVAAEFRHKLERRQRVGEIAATVPRGAELATDSVVAFQDDRGGSVRGGSERGGETGGTASADNDVE